MVYGFAMILNLNKLLPFPHDCCFFYDISVIEAMNVQDTNFTIILYLVKSLIFEWCTLT